MMERLKASQSLIFFGRAGESRHGLLVGVADDSDLSALPGL